MAARTATNTSGRNRPGKLPRSLRNPDAEFREAAVLSIMHSPMPPNKAIKQLTSMIRDKVANVRQAVAMVIGETWRIAVERGDEPTAAGAAEALVALADDPVIAVRNEVYKAIVRLQEKSILTNFPIPATVCGQIQKVLSTQETRMSQKGLTSAQGSGSVSALQHEQPNTGELERETTAPAAANRKNLRNIGSQQRRRVKETLSNPHAFVIRIPDKEARKRAIMSLGEVQVSYCALPDHRMLVAREHIEMLNNERIPFEALS